MHSPRLMSRRPIPTVPMALGLGMAVVMAFAAAIASPPDSTASPKPSASIGGGERIGLESCSARGCHGGVGPTNPLGGSVYIKDGAYTTWRNHDPHRKAYDALLLPRSVEIARKLNLPNAHESKLCLACHSTPKAPGASVILADGIDCEGCHGPAREWLEPHLAIGWPSKEPASKAKLGMVDLSTPTARAESCVDCHVGNRGRGMDVNHDLIAAGHPRLNFEYASYLAAYPKHWREPSKANLDARAWAIGQVVTARAVFRLLADRAADSIPDHPPVRAASSPWPEFAEYECFACHHSLDQPSFSPGRPGPKIGVGRLPWATWPTAMLPTLESSIVPNSPVQPWAELQVEMARREPDASKVADLARKAAGRLDEWLVAIDKASTDPSTVAATLAKAGPDETWDVAAQRYLALAAMARAIREDGKVPAKEVEGVLEAGARHLAFPPRSDSPRRGRPGGP